jgi:hypothetical protein
MMNTEATAKKSYQEPKVIDYGKVADLTKKPGSRTDGSPGTMGNKGHGSLSESRAVGGMMVIENDTGSELKA